MGDGPPKVKLIEPPHPLREKVGPPGKGGVTAEMLARAEQVVAEMAETFHDWAKEDVASIQKACDGLEAAPSAAAAADHLERVFGVAHDLKGQGGSFGYPLITQVGNALCRLVETLEAPGPREIEAIRLHVDAIRLIIANRMTGDGGPEGERLVRGLDLVLRKL